MTDKRNPERMSVRDALNKYKTTNNQLPEEENNSEVINNEIPSRFEGKPASSSITDYEKLMTTETDPDLVTSYEAVKLPSMGILYSNALSEVNVEYMTSKDEDLLTTPSLLENGTVLDVLLNRKIKTKGVVPKNLLAGDRNAILLFLRTSSYGTDYSVQVTDPRTGIPFKAVVDLTKLKYKEVIKKPDENGQFSVEIPMRKKLVKFRLLTVGEEDILFKKAEALKEAYNEEYSQYNTMKLKSSIMSIDGNTDRSYIDKFVDAMPALDAFTIRKEILLVSPDVDMNYEFMASDGYKFKTNLSIGLDFFFPNT
jgi:hypothetical protein